MGVGESEANQPNTIACPSTELGDTDGEAVDRISFFSLDGCDGLIKEGDAVQARFEFTADPLSVETVRLFGAVDAINPVWVLIFEESTVDDPMPVLEGTLGFPIGFSTVAVRAVFGFLPSNLPCPDSQDDFVDRDDLIIPLAPRSESFLEESSPFFTFTPSVASIAATAFDSSMCASLSEGKCAKPDTCEWSEESASCVAK